MQFQFEMCRHRNYQVSHKLLMTILHWNLFHLQERNIVVHELMTKIH